MHLITAEQWFKIDPKLPILYNGSDDVVSIRPDAAEYDDESVIVLPGHVIQVDPRQGYITRITRDGYVNQYLLLTEADEMENFDPSPLLYALRKELQEVTISTGN